jgi:hypothetical protein
LFVYMECHEGSMYGGMMWLCLMNTTNFVLRVYEQALLWNVNEIQNTAFNVAWKHNVSLLANADME